MFRQARGIRLWLTKIDRTNTKIKVRFEGTINYCGFGISSKSSFKSHEDQELIIHLLSMLTSPNCEKKLTVILKKTFIYYTIISET